ncbi:hypothetical protein P869_10815 [Ligilactobacillus ruminis S23]|uniref:restriction endonuclease subunit S n=1 Tax=Ligilactobacillus ruminis TaxID=1623 RepID=UPI00062CBC85|nr:restriction endonuclease subunit S [Ligilactobacillus ruminis]KLA45787.1 hypothetical protein P869_10815 [Ligilactobacillus ruminis S23]
MNYRLSDICFYVKEKVAVSVLENTDYISTENMIPNKGGITTATSLPSSFKTQAYQKHDVLVSNIRPYFKKIWFSDCNGGCSNDVLVFRAKDGTDARFLYYVLADDAFFDYSTATSKGTKMPRGDKTAIMQYEVPYFDLKTQKKIARILTDIDYKITLNNNINKNLEQQAQAIFKSWFVDFDPFGGNRPIDWITGIVDDLGAEIICGKTPSTKKKEYYGGNTPFITIPDMHGCVYNVSTERYLSAAGVASQPKKTLPHNTVCVSCIGTAGLVTLVSEKSQSNQQINSIVPKEGISAYYIYLLMQTLSETINKLGQSGSTIVNLNKTQFGKIPVTIPSEQVLCNFDTLCKPLFEMILSNQKENIKLANLRDTLLPKLMSGELDVSDIDL